MAAEGFTRRSFIATGALAAGALAASPRAGASLARAAAGAHAPTAAQWAALRHSLTGTLVRPTDASYPQARLVYDLRFDQASPAAIAYPRSSTDVQRLVHFARRHSLAPIPRCGGHSYAGYSTGGGLVIDVGAMNAVSVSGSRATVGAGTRLVDMYSALAARGVLVPGGSCPTVGISGLALGGGIGVVARKYGLTADAIEELTLVTADARVLHADASNHADLYWASRGGGGRNFGIATSFAFKARPLPPLALFTLNFPWAAAGDLFGAWIDWIAHAPDELWSNCLLLSAGSSGLIARTTGVYVGSSAALGALVAKLTKAVGAIPSSSSRSPASYLQAMLIEAGCADITLAQCHIQAPGTPGTLPRTAFLAKSAYFSRPLPNSGHHGGPRRRHQLPRAAALARRRHSHSTATAARSTPSRRARPRSSTATRSASCRCRPRSGRARRRRRPHAPRRGLSTRPPSCGPTATGRPTRTTSTRRSRTGRPPTTAPTCRGCATVKRALRPRRRLPLRPVDPARGEGVRASRRPQRPPPARKSRNRERLASRADATPPPRDLLAGASIILLYLL